MEPDRQIEIQLGHMCGNRCVFCVSGQRTEMREAFPIAADPVIEKLREARSSGISKLTLLGGEPTIQPEFFRVVRAAVELGFGEIVVFTNGVKTARGSFVDEVLATGGNFTWRLSFQGADARSHDRTTRKLGSFARLVESLENLRARGQRITVNMCVVRSNYESVPAFPALLVRYGVSQLHLDMIRPLDAGERSEDEMRAMMPRYRDLVPALEQMIAGFPPDFDVNVGNLPYCVAPSLLPFIHHDGSPTLTVAIDGDDSLSEPWDKYEVKRRDKVKVDACRTCLFDDRCSGVFDTYRRFYGTEELVPIDRIRLPLVDSERRMFTMHAEPLVHALTEMGAIMQLDSHAQRVFASFGEIRLGLARPGVGAAGTDQFSLFLASAPAIDATTLALLRRVFAKLVEVSGARALHEVGDDAAHHGPMRAQAGLDGRIGGALARLRASAPYRELTWKKARIGDRGRAAAVVLEHEQGTVVTLSCAVEDADEPMRCGYRLDRQLATPPPGLVEGVRAAMSALAGR